MEGAIGLGDNIMATGLARGASARGKRIAFGNRHKIIWDQNSEVIFRRNANIAPPGSERLSLKNLEWVEFYKGKRGYNRQENGRWIWNYDFKAVPGELFFSPHEWRFGEIAKGCVVIEPSVPAWKSVASNKQWPTDRYDKLTSCLVNEGYKVFQFRHPGTTHTIPGARQIRTATIRLALSALGRSLLYIGAEGGLHHGAAAMGRPAVVLFGGFVPPQVTGYDTHTNLTGGAEACGSLSPCSHCAAAMANISVDEVLAAALKILR